MKHLKLVTLTDTRSFFQIIDLLEREAKEDGQGFYHSRGAILASFKAEKIYIVDDLSLDKVFPEYKHLTPKDKTHKIGFSYAPAFCTMDSRDELEIMWVHEAWRSRGYARFMLKELERSEGYDIIKVDAIPESINFWKHMGFEIEDTEPRYIGTTIMFNTHYTPCMNLSYFSDGTQEVDLSRKRINEIDWDDYPKGLKKIKLQDNEIQEMTWEGCPDTLQEIDLTNNKISKMNFKGCPKGLQKVVLRDNKLVEFDWEGCPNKLQVRVDGFISDYMPPKSVYCANY